MELKVVSINDLTQNELEKVDAFIMSEFTNGEFINSVKYLSYHRDRFVTDSIVICDKQSKTIEGVVMATAEDNMVISHKGTTFAGPIVSLKNSYDKTKSIIELVLDYYENKYDIVCFKTTPTLYAYQETGVLDYILLQHGYKYGMTALSNVIKINSIHSEDELFKLYDSKKRNQVRKAIKCNEFVFNRESLIDEKIWNFMNKNLAEKYQVCSTHSYDEIADLQQRFPNHIVPYTVKTNNGEYAAFGLIFKFKNVFHTQYLDMNYEYAMKCPNLFLVHNLIQEAMKEGYSVFSFGASTENGGEYLNEGLLAYKAGYGGGNIVMPIYIKEKRGIKLCTHL